MPDWSIRHGIASARHLLQVAQRHGATLADCLSHTGIDAADIDRADAEITPEQEFRLIRNVQRLLPEAPGIALEVGSLYQLTDFGIWGYALISSFNLREAMRLALRYLDLSYIYGTLSFEEGDKVSLLSFDYRAIPADIRQFLLERDAAAVNVISQQTFPGARPLREVHLEYPRPRYHKRMAALIGVKPVFAAPTTYTVLDNAVLNRPMPQANQATLRMCEAECVKLLARRKVRSGVSARVRDIILRQPRSAPDMEAIAAELCMTSRTLRRHLALEGATFRVLRDEVLKMLAEELLGTARMKLEEVAERLGYADAAAFSHAFKRWNGCAPGSYRPD